MTYTAPKTWGGSEVLTSADINAQVSGNVEYLYDSKPQATTWMDHGTSVAQVNQRIESGTGYVGITTATYGSVIVAYSAAFGTAPRVVLTETALNYMGMRAANVGTAGFVAYSLYCGTAGTMSGSSYFNWIAIGA